MDSSNTDYEKLPNKKETVDVTWKEKRVKKWNTKDLCDWVKTIGLSEKWQQEMTEAIENIGCTGKDWFPMKNSKDLQNSLDIKQPMLTNRVYREFKKVRKQAEDVKKNNKPQSSEYIAPKSADLEQPVMPQQQPGAQQQQPAMQQQQPAIQQQSVIIQPAQQGNVNYSGNVGNPDNNYEKPPAAYEQPFMQQNPVNPPPQAQVSQQPAIKYVDQYGNPINPPPQAQVSQKANVKYVDQYGNPVAAPKTAPIVQQPAANVKYVDQNGKAVIIQPRQQQQQQQPNVIYAGNVNAGYSNNNVYYQIPSVQPQQPQRVIIVQPRNNYAPQQQYTNTNINTGVVEPYQDLRCLSIIACLVGGWICGLFALCYSSNARNAHERGDYDEYRRQQKNAKICIAISFVAGIFFFIMIATNSMY